MLTTERQTPVSCDKIYPRLIRYYILTLIFSGLLYSTFTRILKKASHASRENEYKERCFLHCNILHVYFSGGGEPRKNRRILIQRLYYKAKRLFEAIVFAPADYGQ